MLPKCLKWLQEAGSAFFGKDIKFMLVMTNYAKIYASTIYQSLIWCLQAGCLFGPEENQSRGMRCFYVKMWNSYKF